MAYKYKSGEKYWIRDLGDSCINIEESKSLVKSMECKCKEYTKLLELAERNKFETIIANISYSISLRVAEGVRLYLNGDKTEDNESCHHYLNSVIYDILGVSVSVDNVVLYGYEGCAYQFEFEYLGTRYGLIVPMMEKLTQQNYKHASEGMMSIAVIDDISISYFASSYEEEDIRIAFQNKIKEQKESK